MGVHPHAQHANSAVEIVLPQLLVPLGVAVAAEDVVDEDVEASLLLVDPGDELGHLVRLEMVDAERSALSAGGLDQLARLLDRLGTVHVGRPVRSAAASGGVDECACARELDGDRAAGSARRAGDQRDLLL